MDERRQYLRPLENGAGQPLGYCEQCDRVRWLADVNEGNGMGEMPRGTCRTCWREAATAAAPKPGSENFSAPWPGYTPEAQAYEMSIRPRCRLSTERLNQIKAYEISRGE